MVSKSVTGKIYVNQEPMTVINTADNWNNSIIGMTIFFEPIVS